MKKVLKNQFAIIALAVSLCGMAALPVAFTGCGTTKQEVAYKTIYTVQQATVAAYDAYISQVIAGRVPTNGVPAVSKAFDSFQAATRVAETAAQWNTNAPASSQLTTLSADLLSLIAAVSKK